MRKKPETIIAICIILGFSLIWIGALIASFYRNLFILFLILGIVIIAFGLTCAAYNQRQEHKLGIDVEEQKREQEEAEKKAGAMFQSPLPTLPKIARLYGALILAIPLFAITSSV